MKKWAAAVTPSSGPWRRRAPRSSWRWTRIGRRNTYPLALSRADETVAGRIVLIGNAAQALHPVAGQGFNLGLRDAATLAEMLAANGAGDVEDINELLTRFAAWRAED